jgi:hypothetical protein
MPWPTAARVPSSILYKIADRLPRLPARCNPLALLHFFDMAAISHGLPQWSEPPRAVTAAIAADIPWRAAKFIRLQREQS